MMKDSLGDRLKADYERRTRLLLPRRTYTLIRVDGKVFHSYTRNCQRPYDSELMEDMDTAGRMLCENITGAQIAFVQSDEISILLTDFAAMQTEAWFDGNVQKLASVSASIATAHFNQARRRRLTDTETSLAYFDSRAFTIPSAVDVENYFIWRQQDTARNSISMTAQAHLAHSALQGKSCDEMQEMLWQEKGVNWNDMPGGFKRGRCIVRNIVTKDAEYLDKRTEETRTIIGVKRQVWECLVPPIFTQERGWLRARIPRHEL